MIRSLLFGLVLILLPGGVNANTYYVTTTTDTGAGSLRSMIDSANANSGLDTVSLSLGAHDTIHIAGPLPIITDSLVITGRPCQNPTVNGDSLGFIIPAFLVANAAIPLTINYLNIFNCKFTNLSDGISVFDLEFWNIVKMFYDHIKGKGDIWTAGIECRS